MIEDIILSNSQRGMDVLVPYLDEAYCLRAAEALLRCSRRTVFIMTGFYVNGHAETDGPPGAYFLAKALSKLNFTPIIVTDNYCKEFFQLKNVHDTIYMSVEEKYPAKFCANALKKYKPVCMISIERCGRTAYRRYLNMRGVDITVHTAPIDEFFQMADDILTIGIGDGGNEIGMGNLHKIIEERFSIAPSIIKTEHLIAATTSNWGAYGFLAYLEKLTGLSLLPEYQAIHDYLKRIISLGAVDGVTGVHEATVDGFKQEAEREIVHRLHKFLKDGHKQQMEMSDDYNVHSLSQMDIGLRLISILKAYVDKRNITNCNLLDVGCGTGNLTDILYSHLTGKDIKVYGMDIDKVAINKASDLYAEIIFFVDDIQRMTNYENKYCLLFSNETLHWMPIPPKEISNANGAIYYFFTEDTKKLYRNWALCHFKRSLTNIFNLLENNGMAFLQFGRSGQLRLFYRIINDTIIEYFHSYQRLVKFPLYYPEDEEIFSLLNSIGFKVVEKQLFSELLYEKKTDDVINFLSGFTKPYFNRIMGKENTEKVYKKVKKRIILNSELFTSEQQWNRTILILTK